MRVLVAFDKFKDAMPAAVACRAAAEEIRRRHPDWTVDECPLSDGGEGFSSLLTAAAGGRRQSVPVAGPRGETLEAGFGLVPARNLRPAARERLEKAGARGGEDELWAVVEMAEASGLALLPPEARDPWVTTTLGTGQLILAAVQAGAHAVLLGVGGSATHDLGLGALSALGLRCEAEDGSLVSPPCPRNWGRIARLSGRIAPGAPPILIACDVTNPLLGPRGAAAVFGPQKGLRPEDRAELEEQTARQARLLCAWAGVGGEAANEPGTGAAGGIAFGFRVAAGARLVPGARLIADWLGLEERVRAADLVLTGEGRFDDSSVEGKGPGEIAAQARRLGKAVQVFAGQLAVTQPHPGVSFAAITPSGTPLPQALRDAEMNLRAAVARVSCGPV